MLACRLGRSQVGTKAAYYYRGPLKRRVAVRGLPIELASKGNSAVILSCASQSVAAKVCIFPRLVVKLLQWRSHAACNVEQRSARGLEAPRKSSAKKGVRVRRGARQASHRTIVVNIAVSFDGGTGSRSHGAPQINSDPTNSSKSMEE